MAKSYKLRIYEILESTNAEDKTAEAVNLFMLVLVVLNVTAVFLETVESIYAAHRVLFHYFSDITALGKLAGGLIIILGVATFALPTSILTSGFVDELERRRVEKEAQEKESPR
ncbi:MAG: hypothetical protein WAW52_14110 [Methanothrix sp.]